MGVRGRMGFLALAFSARPILLPPHLRSVESERESPHQTWRLRGTVLTPLVTGTQEAGLSRLRSGVRDLVGSIQVTQFSESSPFPLR